MSDKLTDRERELVEAVKAACPSAANPVGSFEGYVPEYQRLIIALRAYDPPKRKYTMPNWASFAALSEMDEIDDASVSCRGLVVPKYVYLAIREALSTEEE